MKFTNFSEKVRSMVVGGADQKVMSILRSEEYPDLQVKVTVIIMSKDAKGIV